MELGNTGATDFYSQINFAINNVTSEYFMVLEHDDEVMPNILIHVNEYIKRYSSAPMFMPLIIESDLEKRFLRYSNEMVWTKDFTEKLGILDLQALLSYANFNIIGSVIKTSDFLEVGGIKTSMKLVNVFEFLLRFIHQDKQVVAIPKVGYIHKNGRENSIFAKLLNSENKVTPEEVHFWFETAKKEYYFSTDRQVTYGVTA